jgi:hypothetical protein
MSVNMHNIRQLVRELELSFWISENGSCIAIPYHADNGRRSIDVLIQLHEENTFLQFSAALLFNVEDDENLIPVLRAINSANHGTRFIKVTYDADSRAIRAYADLWLQDGTMTALQFSTMLNNFACGVLQAQRAVLHAVDEAPAPQAEQEAPF